MNEKLEQINRDIAILEEEKKRLLATNSSVMLWGSFLALAYNENKPYPFSLEMVGTKTGQKIIKDGERLLLVRDEVEDIVKKMQQFLEETK